MSPQLHPTAEAPSDISYSPVTQYPSPYASHAYSGKSMVWRNSPAFTPGGPAWIMSVEQTLPSQVAKSKLPLGNGLCLALPCPGRPQDGLGEGSWPWPSATPGAIPAVAEQRPSHTSRREHSLALINLLGEMKPLYFPSATIPVLLSHPVLLLSHRFATSPWLLTGRAN